VYQQDAEQAEARVEALSSSIQELHERTEAVEADNAQLRGLLNDAKQVMHDTDLQRVDLLASLQPDFDAETSMQSEYANSSSSSR